MPPLGHGRRVGNVVVLRYRTRGRLRYRKCRWCPISETSSCNLPQRGNAYQAGHRPGNCKLPQRGQRIPGRASPWELQIAPTGQRIPAQGGNPGTRIRENRCVLKEHRIGWGGVDVQDTESMRRSFRTRVSFAWWIPRVGTLSWYAMPRWGMGTKTWWRDWLQRSRADTSERDARLGMDAGSKCHCSICPNGAPHTRQGIALGTANCPEGGNAYQPRVPTLGTASERIGVF
jgi:hypothetical protein